MKIIEIKSAIDPKGSITLPSKALYTAGLIPGDPVSVTLAVPEESAGPMLAVTPPGMKADIQLPSGQDHDNENEVEEVDIQLPNVLLEEAGIPVGSDLDISCGGGAIIITASDILDNLPEELQGLFDSLDINPDTIREVMKKEGYFV